jgi:hypothetical protein
MSELLAAQSSGGAIVVTAVLPDWIPDKIRPELDAIVRDTVRIATGLIGSKFSDEANVIADTGQLAQSFGAPQFGGSILDGGASFGEVVSPLPYAIVQMETGRRAGAAMPPLAAIELWAMRKLGLDGASAHRAAWPIAQAIARRGLPPSTRAEDAIEAAEGPVDSLFGQVCDQMSEGIASAMGFD